jgi:hypothetical protein
MKEFSWQSIPIRRWDARKYASAVKSLSCCLEAPGESSSVSDADKVLIAQTSNYQDTVRHRSFLGTRDLLVNNFLHPIVDLTRQILWRQPKVP